MKHQQVHVVIKSLPDQKMDIFWGNGWDNWSRVQLSAGPKPEFTHVAGIRLPFYVRIATTKYLKLT